MQPLDDYANLMPLIDRIETGQAEFLGGLLYDLLQPKRVIDWGCASGLYLVPFKRYGCRVLGLDADNASAKQLEDEESMLADLRYPIPIPLKFDLALCIETAEHLQPEYADQLVENVAHSADTVFFSAAHPGQGGQNHWNEKTPEYWRIRFDKHGFKPHPLISWVSAAIAENPECRKVSWLIPNAMLLQRKP